MDNSSTLPSCQPSATAQLFALRQEAPEAFEAAVPIDSPEAIACLVEALQRPGCDIDALAGAWTMLELGYTIVPTEPGAKKPARTYDEQTRSWWTLLEFARRGDTAFGVCPQPGDLFLDRDRSDDPEWLAALPPTMTVTRGDHVHRYYRLSEPVDSRNGERIDDVDVRMACKNGSTRSLLICPGTLHAGGRERYVLHRAPVASVALSAVPGAPGRASGAVGAPVPPAPEPSDADLETAWDGLPAKPYAADLVIWLQTEATPPVPGDGGTAFMGTVGAMLARWPDLTHAEAVFALEAFYNPRCDGLITRWTRQELSHKVNDARNGPKVHEARQVEEFLRRAREHAAEEREEHPPTAELEWIDDDGEPAPVDWVCEELGIERGTRPVVVYGLGGVGKSFIMQGLVAALVGGKAPWCGGHPAGKIRAGHIDFEQGIRRVSSRYRQLKQGLGMAPNAPDETIRKMAFPSRNLTSRDAEDWLVRHCQGLDLVVLDPLRDAIPGVDENDSTMGSFMSLLTKVAGIVGCAFVVIHHASKGTGDLRGSTAIQAAASVVLKVEQEGPQVKVSWAKANNREMAAPIYLTISHRPELGISDDGAAIAIEQVERRQAETSAVEGRLDSVAERIKEALRQNAGRIVGARYLAEMVGGKGSDIQAAKERLIQQGWIEREKHNGSDVYLLHDPPVPPYHEHIDLPPNVIPIRPRPERP